MPNPNVNRNITLSGTEHLPVAFGQLFSDDYTRADAGTPGGNYTLVSTTAAIVSNKMVTADAGGTFNAKISYSGYGYSQLNSWTQVIDSVVPSTAALSFLGIGVLSKALSPVSSVQAGLLVFSGGLASQAKIYMNGVTIATSGATMNVTAGDLLRTTFAFSGRTYLLTINNITAGTQISVGVSPNTAASAIAIHGMGWFTIYPYAGIQTISNWNVTTTELKYADYGFVGDSITQIFCASLITNCFAMLTGAAKNKTVAKFAGGNNKTADIINALPEIIAFKPKRIFLMIGGNDISGGVPQATREANYISIISSLSNVGIPIKHLYATPRTATNITAQNTFIASLGVSYIDTYTPMWSGVGTGANPALYQADLIHPIDSGHSTLSSTIVAAI